MPDALTGRLYSVMNQSLDHQSLTIRTKSFPTKRGKLRLELQILSPVTRTIHVGHTNAGGEVKHEVAVDLPLQSPLSLAYYMAAEDVLGIQVFGEDFGLDEVYFQADENCQDFAVRYTDADSLHTNFIIEEMKPYQRPYSTLSSPDDSTDSNSTDLLFLPWLR